MSKKTKSAFKSYRESHYMTRAFEAGKNRKTRRLSKTFQAFHFLEMTDAFIDAHPEQYFFPRPGY